MRLFVALAVGSAGALLLALGSAARPTTTLSFSFRTYANNVKVVAPLVGDWQLGEARLRGSGRAGGGATGGMIEGGTDPLLARYRPASIRARVIGYKYLGGAHGSFRKLTLTVEIVDAVQGGPNCVPGTRGVVTLYDSDERLDNGQPSDYVVMGKWGGRCPTFVKGWTNEDGGARTSPSRGGPPRGGQWAIVSIKAA